MEGSIPIGKTVHHVAMYAGHHEIFEGVIRGFDGSFAIVELPSGETARWPTTGNHRTRRAALSHHIATLGREIEKLATAVTEAAIELHRIDGDADQTRLAGIGEGATIS